VIFAQWFAEVLPFDVGDIQKRRKLLGGAFRKGELKLVEQWNDKWVLQLSFF
jgi:hypothetical protein